MLAGAMVVMGQRAMLVPEKMLRPADDVLRTSMPWRERMAVISGSSLARDADGDRDRALLLADDAQVRRESWNVRAPQLRLDVLEEQHPLGTRRG
ncbi:hypothetical protein FM125_04145 [Micrococcus lylae]|uniref:Uncharacterized protein n=1 Tax=Micrococcus lylae TaxID=1273 RepID=A0A1R4IRH3_9MICC|nr:hypothetical protein FM125_04145 [Micrococcus lylae]